jgi:hypothetical protein
MVELDKLRDMLDEVGEEAQQEGDSEHAGMERLCEIIGMDERGLWRFSMARADNDILPTARAAVMEITAESGKMPDPSSVMAGMIATGVMDGFILGAAWAQSRLKDG